MNTIDRTANLRAAAYWLLESQKQSPDDGYSAYYHIKSGWSNSYPETTGYIIPTMFRLREVFGEDFTDSAVRAADWLVDIQDEDGSYQGGLIGEGKYPVVFNTGQVMFGLNQAYKSTRKKKYLDSMKKSLEWLRIVQDTDGAWRRFLSKKGSGEFHIYSTRVALGILEGAKTLKQNDYYECARMNFEFACRFQKDNGWFEKTDLEEDRNDEPLLHFVAYTIEGLLRGGIFLKNKKYIAVAQKSLDALFRLQEEYGCLMGRNNAEWQPTVKWSCLTAVAQVAILWMMLYEILRTRKYLEAAITANDFLSDIQILDSSDPGVKGGLAGSFPLDDDYESCRYLNWATKFFVDSLMLERKYTR